jgi:type IV secretion system protein VirB9
LTLYGRLSAIAIVATLVAWGLSRGVEAQTPTAPVSATASAAPAIADTTVMPIAVDPAPVEAPDGSLRYPYGGKTQPLLTCRPLYVCDVILEQGETILNIAIGDSLRWVIAPAQSGPGGSTPHVFVKPTDVNLATNLVITTTKRVYYIRLKSDTAALAPRISYSYPEEEAAAIAAREAIERASIEDKATELPLLPPDQLDYNYRIQGPKQILPQKVYNDGVHSFIEYTALPTDLPVVYAVAPDGSDQIVNFRLRGTIFIVDGIPSGFDIVLNGGTGKHGRGELRVFVRHK